MRITWKDGVTTLAAGSAVLLERAYFWRWDWPLLSSMRWTLTGLGLLMAVSLALGYLLDEDKTSGWNWFAGLAAVTAAAFVGLGLAYVISDYVVLAMVAVVTFWAVSVLRHLSVHSPVAHGPHFGY